MSKKVIYIPADLPIPMLKGKKTPEPKSTLYCSFCGKSQYEVDRMIAGPTVFICDECIASCDDIVLEGSFPDRIVLRVRIPSGSIFDDAINEAIAESLKQQYPDIDVRYEHRSINGANTRNEFPVTLIFSYGRIYGDALVAKEKYEEISKQLTREIAKATTMKAKFLNESHRVEVLTQELTALKDEYLEHLRLQRKLKEEKTDLYSVVFLDVKGFSKFNDADKRRVLELIRGLVPPLLVANGAKNVNMWGDGIVAIFDDVNQSVDASVRFLRHLSVDRLDARIGMAWGQLSVRYNPAINRTDIEGATVDKAARLEGMAEPGEIILSEEYGGHDIDENIGKLMKQQITVKKAFSTYEVGDEITVYKLRVISN